MAIFSIIPLFNLIKTQARIPGKATASMVLRVRSKRNHGNDTAVITRANTRVRRFFATAATIHQATGKRVRQLPLSKVDLKWS
jgi:hypothetical protein